MPPTPPASGDPPPPSGDASAAPAATPVTNASARPATVARAVGGGGPGSIPGGFGPGQPPQFAVAPQQRASLSSMLFMTFFFFMMSGNNNEQTIEIIEGMHRVREVEYMKTALANYTTFLQNGTMRGNDSVYAFPPEVEPSFEKLLPPRKEYPLEDDRLYYRNISGFYRKSEAHYLNLTHPSTSPAIHDFFHHLNPSSGSMPDSHPNEPYENEKGEAYLSSLINMTTFNATRAHQMLSGRIPPTHPPYKPRPGEIGPGGEDAEERPAWTEEWVDSGWRWEAASEWEMNIKEKKISVRGEEGDVIQRSGKKQKEEWDDWTWSQATMTFTDPDTSSRISYDLKGFHHIPTGIYTLLGKPEGQNLDIRDIPVLFPEGHDRNLTESMVLWEMRRRMRIVRETMILALHQEDDPSPKSTCPLYLRFRLPPFPSSYTSAMYDAYEAELRDPSGISLPGPPIPVILEGVAVLQGCGVAFGLDKGESLLFTTFWTKSIQYAFFASIATVGSLMLLVYQMESTRTPSALAKVSFWTLAMMVCADSWMFSGHLVMALISDNPSTLSLLVPSFFSLCAAIVFGPRFAVHIQRVQAPENQPATRPVTRPTPPAPVTAGAGAGTTTPTAPAAATAAAESEGVGAWIADELNRNPKLKVIIPLIIFFILVIFDVLPNILPLFIAGLYSFWVPQIIRNVSRGNRKALTWRFVFGSSITRLALPVYLFAWPDNIFFVDKNDQVWLLVAWVWIQVLLLVAQDRFGPAFFLPKSFAPGESYDYHQPIPPPDPEAPHQDFGDCSICMEPIVIDAAGHDSKGRKDAGGVGQVLNLNVRRTYALAPCHHLFHTACLSQWLAIKTTCPLCKRSLPPL